METRHRRSYGGVSFRQNFLESLVVRASLKILPQILPQIGSMAARKPSVALPLNMLMRIYNATVTALFRLGTMGTPGTGALNNGLACSRCAG
jgi:hypothetical protein